MKPVAFEYVAARSLEEALAALDEGGEDAKPIAGGQSLVPALNMRLVRPTLLVDLNRAGPRRDRGQRRRPGRRHGAPGGARARPARRTRCCARRCPTSATSSPATAARSAAASPTPTASAEIPLCLAALGGTIVADGPGGRREIAPDAFFVTHYLTTLAPGELVVETTWPLPAENEGAAFEELALRAGDYALAMVAVVLRRVDGVARDVRDPRRRRHRPADGARRRRAGGRAARRDGGVGARGGRARRRGRSTRRARSTPRAAYLRHLTGTLVERALLRAWERAA